MFIHLSNPLYRVKKKPCGLLQGFFVDSNVISDVFLDDPNWAEAALADDSMYTPLYINSMAMQKYRLVLKKIEELESAFHKGGFQMIQVLIIGHFSTPVRSG